MIYANFVAGFKENEWFSKEFQDNRGYPFWLLREKFKAYGIELNSEDVNFGKDISFELHMNVQRDTSVPAYLFLWETSLVYSLNASPILQSKYRMVFTWDGKLADGHRYIKFHLPMSGALSPFNTLGWGDKRDRGCCLIASNKTTWKADWHELYSKRVETIRWFERCVPEFFDLYGIGWNEPPCRVDFLGRSFNKILLLYYKWAKKMPFPSYRGRIDSKNEILSKYRFSICYENVSDLQDYITEKIFDCFFAGCVPIYWGASNIADYIPAECFVDRRKFSDHQSLYDFLHRMTEEEFIKYQLAIKNYLVSDAVIPFYAESFATGIVDVVVSDLKKTSVHVEFKGGNK